MRHLTLTAALLLGAATAAVQAQDNDLSLSLGLRAWNTEWTTFSYFPINPQDSVVTQVPARDKLVLVPTLSLRWRDAFGSVSLYPTTEHSMYDGLRSERREFDLNAGYYVLPGLAVTLGYKKMVQTDGRFSYRPAGPVVGLSATAPLGAGLNVYGAFGVGWLKTPAARNTFDVVFDAEYRLTELGLAYSLPVTWMAKALTLTAGYRTQVLSSKQARGDQDGRDLTQGLTVGLVASF